MNTRYYSFYNQDKGTEKSEKETALENIEEQLAVLKSQSQKLASEKWGFSHEDKIDELQPQVNSQALKAYEAFIADR